MDVDLRPNHVNRCVWFSFSYSFIPIIILYRGFAQHARQFNFEPLDLLYTLNHVFPRYHNQILGLYTTIHFLHLGITYIPPKGANSRKNELSNFEPVSFARKFKKFLKFQMQS